MNSKPDFDYPHITALDIAIDPQKLWTAIFVWMENQKVICNKCKKIWNIHVEDRHITAKCDCGTGILYPKRQDRGECYLFRWVSKKEHERGRQENGYL